MKKRVIILLALIAIVLCYQNVSAKELTYIKSVEGVSIYTEGTSKRSVKSADKYLDTIPERLYEQISSWSLVFTSKDIGRNYVGMKGVFSGVTLPENKTIYIRATKSSYKYTILHELGHAFDIENNWLSVTDEFSNIYAKEKNSFKETAKPFNDGHAIESVKEYFAAAFQEFLLDKKTLKKNTPKTYKYMKNFICGI